VYLNPSRKRDYDAVAFLWARQSQLESGLEERLFAVVRGWLADLWPFKKVAFPGRDVDWDVWRSLPE
jgi:hypothetical protein